MDANFPPRTNLPSLLEISPELIKLAEKAAEACERRNNMTPGELDAWAQKLIDDVKGDTT
jgi:hypothetical protein